MPEFRSAVRRGLKVAMAEADMTPRELAEKSGVSEALGCSPNDLCGIE